MYQNSLGTAKIECPRSTCHVRKPSSIYHRTGVTRGPRAHLLLLRGKRALLSSAGIDLDERHLSGNSERLSDWLELP